MRMHTMAAAALAAALSASGLSIGVAKAQAMPAGVHSVHGALSDAAGKPLYTFKWDTMVGMSHCDGPCAKTWPPLVAPAGAKPTGAWTIIDRGGGVNQWAYKDKPLYTYSKDVAGQPGTGETAGGNWTLAH
jgi:predicted lipoprotein with Yx(FWY)xxD motif